MVNSHVTLRRMKHIGGEGIILGDNKVWTNSGEIMKRLRDEFHRRKWMKEKRIQSQEKSFSTLVEEGINAELYFPCRQIQESRNPVD